MAETKDVSLYIRRLQVISQDGLTIYHYPDTFQKNPQLISGMLSAVFLFIQEEYGGSVKSIMLSDRKLNFVRYGNYLIILELETYVDDGCTQIFFDYLLDLLQPVFDKAGMDYNLAISLLEGIDMRQIFNYHRQLEILMRHEVPKALQGACVLLRKNGHLETYNGDWDKKSTDHFLEMFNRSDELFQKSIIEKANDGSFQSVISDDVTHAGLLFLSLPNHNFELMIAVIEELDELLLNIGSGLKNMFNYLFALYPDLELDRIMDYLLSLRFPIEQKHEHETAAQEPISMPDLTPLKLGVLAFELLGSDLPLMVEKTFIGEKIAIAGGEISAHAIKNLFEHFLPTLVQNVPVLRNEMNAEGSPLLLIHPDLADEAKQLGYSVVFLGDQRQKIRKQTTIVRAYGEACKLPPDNRVFFFAERIREITQIYGEILFCVVAEFNRDRARKQLQGLKSKHKEIFELGKKRLFKDHPKLKPHFLSLEKGLIN